jgi:beta-phosphoglucomutase-like phosphatase (HAD superfamily)
MLELPGEVSACLFDMDGVVTQTSAAAVFDDAGEFPGHGAGIVVRNLAELLDKDDR